MACTYVVLGLPAWVPLVATVIGLVGDLLFDMTVHGGSWSVLDRLASHLDPKRARAAAGPLHARNRG